MTGIGHNGGPPLEPVELNDPQIEFFALDKKFKAFVGGFGSGKTWVGCNILCDHADAFPRINSGYFAPTYAHIRDIFWPTIEEVAPLWGYEVEILRSDKIVKLYERYRDEGGRVRRRIRSKIFCRSMDNPATIVGFKIGHAVVDEIDLMAKLKATQAWRKIIARMRYKIEGLKNGIAVTTTPEGFNFVYEQFVKQIREKPELAKLYGIVQASTYDNEGNLPDDYIDSLFATYPAQLIKAYLNGEFVNLAAGTVYASFNRAKNNTSAEIMPGEVLHVGMDFNVMNMTATISVIRNGEPLTLAELTKVRDTPEMSRLLKDRYQTGENRHQINVYPDASGQNTSSKNASESDLSILRAAGFNVMVNSQNPRVKDRVLSVNAMFENGKGERRLLVNVNNCPTLTEALEQQAYDINGEPDKKTGHDHPNDALGYFINFKFPVKKIGIARPVLLGV